MLVDVKRIGLLRKVVVSDDPPCSGFLVIVVPNAKSVIDLKLGRW
jgi:hypothetical protein